MYSSLKRNKNGKHIPDITAERETKTANTYQTSQPKEKQKWQTHTRHRSRKRNKNDKHIPNIAADLLSARDSQLVFSNCRAIISRLQTSL